MYKKPRKNRRRVRFVFRMAIHSRSVGLCGVALALVQTIAMPSGFCLQAASLGSVSSPLLNWPAGDWTLSFDIQTVIPFMYSHPIRLVQNPVELAGLPAFCQNGFSAFGSFASPANPIVLWDIMQEESLYFLFGDSVRVAFPDVSINSGNWTHVALAYSTVPPTLAVYIDGRRAGVAPLDAPLPACPPAHLFLGRERWRTAANARFDSLRVFSAAINASTALALFEGHRTPLGAAALVLEWNFDDVDAFWSRSNVTDSAGGGLFGTALVEEPKYSPDTSLFPILEPSYTQVRPLRSSTPARNIAPHIRPWFPPIFLSVPPRRLRWAWQQPARAGALWWEPWNS